MIDDPNTLREIKRENDLLVNAIRSIQWIKPLERRAPNQCTAHTIIDFFRPAEANLAIKNGLLILGKRCNSRKLFLEPTRCMKCQSFNGHYAKDCTSLHNTCGMCSREHRTKDCTDTSPDKRCYANCKEHGHAAWDHECPTFINLSKCYHLHLPDVAYRYFPESNDPAMWVQENETDQAWQDPP